MLIAPATISRKQAFYGSILYLVIVPIVIYWQVMRFPFIDFDDSAYITDNPFVRNGLSIHGLIWAFTKTHAGNWHPLTWISHSIDCSLFGLDAGKHHAVNVCFHIVNSLLLLVLIFRLTGSMFQSWFVAAFFAVHPLNVESVVWISERKNVLSTFFWLLTMMSYYGYAQTLETQKLRYALLFFLLGLMTKPMLVTLPFVLLLLDFFPLNRLQLKSPADLIREKLPFFGLSAASSIITLFAQKSGGAVASLAAHPIHDRIATAIIAYLDYLTKILYPQNLAILYPYPTNISYNKVLFSLLLLGLLTIIAMKTAKKYPVVITGWFWYIGTLIPVIGLVQVGHQSMADRYAYVPMIGIFIMMACSLSVFGNNYRIRDGFLIFISSIWISLYIPVSLIQTGYWENSVTLFRQSLRVTSNNYVIHKNLGNTLVNHGELDEALYHFQESVRINPNYADAYNSLGVALNLQGKTDEAVHYFQTAVQIKSDYAEPYLNIGDILLKRHNVEEAVSWYRKSLDIQPENAKAHNNLGVALAILGNVKEAADHFQKALQVNPDDPSAKENLRKAKNQ